MEKFHGALPLSILLDFLVKSHNAVSDAILGKLGTDSGEMLAVVVQFDGFLIFPFLKHAHFFAHADIKESVVTAFFKFVKELAELFRLDV